MFFEKNLQSKIPMQVGVHPISTYFIYFDKKPPQQANVARRGYIEKGGFYGKTYEIGSFIQNYSFNVLGCTLRKYKSRDLTIYLTEHVMELGNQRLP